MLDRSSWNASGQVDVDWDWLKSEFPDRYLAIAHELNYYNVYGQLPDDAWVIERIEWVNDSAIIVHRDPDERHD